MNNIENEAINDQLESIIDKTSLHDTLTRIGNVCMKKGEHLRVNWQDRNTAKCWERSATWIDVIAERIRKEYQL